MRPYECKNYATMEIHPKDKRKLPTILIAVTLIGQLHDDVILLLLQNPLMGTRN